MAATVFLFCAMSFYGTARAEDEAGSDGIAAALAADSTQSSSPIVRFYQERNFLPAWTGSSTAEADAEQALAALARAGEQGLRKEDYAVAATRPAHGEEDIRYDLALTAAVLRYASDVRIGRSNLRLLDNDIDLPQQDFDAAAELASALNRDRLSAFFEELPPPQPQYRRLVEALAADREAAGGKDTATTWRIVANMERWRWMPRDLEDRYIAINPPEQVVRFMRDGTSVLESKAVVGMESSRNRTPIQRTAVIAVIVNPSWDVPDDIAAPLLARQRQSPAYLESRGMTEVDGHVRQQPGPRNPLGVLMFDTPNRFGSYMHDTPNKHLFDLDDRRESHGCIRVQRISELAALALSDDSTESLAQIRAAIATGETQRIPLDPPLPVYEVYWTVVPTDEGKMKLLPDIYGRDQRLIAMLSHPRRQEADAGSCGEWCRRISVWITSKGR